MKRLLILCVAAIALSSCTMKPVKLQNGFALIHNIDGYSIVLKDEIVIEDIDELWIGQEIIIGHTVSGYFIVPTIKSNINADEERFNLSYKSREQHPGQKSVALNEFLLKDCHKGLDKKTWLSLLPKYGIKDAPKMKSPWFY